MTIVSMVLVAAGVFLLLTGALGLIRFPDFYSRMHAAGKCDTLGSLLILTGLASYQGFDLAAVKLLVVAVFIFITSPTATHAIARAAHRNEIPAWTAEDDA
ncbi:MAG: cation:proton antiporter [Acidobacteria bacterium]|nr:cation:proton antiporter [Acidobacteriota bacterium]